MKANQKTVAAPAIVLARSANPLVRANTDAAIGAFDAHARHEKARLSIGKTLAALYRSVKSDADFIRLFGDGKKITGEITDDARSAVCKMSKEKQKGVLDQIKSRKTNARRLYEAKVVLGDDEDLQAGIKRLAKSTPTAPKASAPILPSEASTFAELAKKATLEELADAVSLWLTTHNKQAGKLATALADFMKPAEKKTPAKKVA